MSQSVHRHFHDELRRLKASLHAMSVGAGSAVSTAVDALLTRDLAKAADVVRNDRVIDQMENEIEDACIALLALQQPLASDLRTITSILKVATCLERVGDHAVNIAQSAERLSNARGLLPEPEVREMARLAREMQSDAINALIIGDAAAGRDVLQRDDLVDTLNRSIFRILLTHMIEDPRVISAGIELLLVSRNLERVADLATNIGEYAVYTAEGKSIRHSEKSNIEEVR